MERPTRQAIRVTVEGERHELVELEISVVPAQSGKRVSDALVLEALTSAQQLIRARCALRRAA